MYEFIFKSLPFYSKTEGGQLQLIFSSLGKPDDN